jgi:hypothetical protein
MESYRFLHQVDGAASFGQTPPNWRLDYKPIACARVFAYQNSYLRFSSFLLNDTLYFIAWARFLFHLV